MDKITGHLIMIQQMTIEALLLALKESDPELVKRYEERRNKLFDAYGAANPEIRAHLAQFKAETTTMS